MSSVATMDYSLLMTSDFKNNVFDDRHDFWSADPPVRDSSIDSPTSPLSEYSFNEHHLVSGDAQLRSTLFATSQLLVDSCPNDTAQINYSCVPTDVDIYDDIPPLSPDLITCTPVTVPTFTPLFPMIDGIIGEVREQIQQEKEIFTSPPPSVSPSVGTESGQSSPSPVHFSIDSAPAHRVLTPAHFEELNRNHLVDAEGSDGDRSTPGPDRKKKGISLNTLSQKEIAERKREQNRLAARVYREKQRNHKKNNESSVSKLSDRNDFLRKEQARLEAEVADLKKKILGQQLSGLKK